MSEYPGLGHAGMSVSHAEPKPQASRIFGVTEGAGWQSIMGRAPKLDRRGRIICRGTQLLISRAEVEI